MSKKENLSVEPYKGVRDFYPEDQAFLNYVTATMREVVESFGYVEYHASVLEPSELYKSKGTENEEIVKEQTYTFIDRGGREVTLRPEMTPTVARMVAARRRELGFPLRLYSIPNLFRYERPQRGRLREHWQLNVDLFGTKSIFADTEIIATSYAIMKAFGATDNDFIIKLGSRSFLDALVHELTLSEDQAKDLRSTLDRRTKMPQDTFVEHITALGVSMEMLSADKAPEDTLNVITALNTLGIENVIFDPSIVRGFDYYTGVVFEVFDTHPDNNRAMFGGGRYDNLTALFDDEPIAGVGFGMGDATIHNFLEVRGLLPTYVPPTKVYVATTNTTYVSEALRLAAELRKGNVATAVDFGEKKLADQIKTASKHKIPYLLVVGEDELTSNTFTIRDLETGDEKKFSREQLGSFFSTI